MIAPLLLGIALAAAPADHAATKPVLPFIEDDYPKALAAARAKGVPIFAEAWAPWCHTCRSMRAFVFTDPALAKHVGRFVWLSIDTEKARNAPFTHKYPIRAWPSFYVIDPNQEAVTLRWVGGATVGQLEKLFAEGAPGRQPAARPGADALARADALYARGKYAEAIPEFREAVRSLPAGAPEYPRAAEALLYSLQVGNGFPECLDVARGVLPRVRGTASEATVAGSGLDCALSLPKDAPDRAEAVSQMGKATRAALDDPTLRLASDDRSALYSLLSAAREDAGDAAGARKIAEEWVADLDREAEGVKTAEQRTAMDPNRLGAYQAVGQIEKAIPMLEQSERDFPDDYNPPSRLALVYLKLGRLPEALAADDRALARVYGPRRLRVLTQRADIYEAMGDPGAARRTLSEAVAYAEALPPGQRSDAQISALRKRLEKAPPAR